MAVSEAIAQAYRDYLAAMDETRQNRRRIDGLLGLGGGAGLERCQDDFVLRLTEAVEEYAASAPDEASVAETLRYMFAQALERRKDREAYWMLLASHSIALPLLDLLGPGEAASLRGFYEETYPRRERLPAQKAVINVLKSRERA